MSDLIRRQAAIEALENDKTLINLIVRGMSLYDAQLEHCVAQYNQVGYDINTIEQLPSAQPERKKGTWIKKMQITETTEYSSYNPRWYCSCCHTEYDPAIANEINFCWKCGADMRGEQDDSVSD